MNFNTLLIAITLIAVCMIHKKLNKQRKNTEHMSQELDNLTQKVQESTTVEESAIALLNDLGQRIRDLADDPAALNALADQLDQEKTKLADAVAANTIAAPEES